jgi:hypothetical protein
MMIKIKKKKEKEKEKDNNVNHQQFSDVPYFYFFLSLYNIPFTLYKI